MVVQYEDEAGENDQSPTTGILGLDCRVAPLTKGDRMNFEVGEVLLTR